MLVKFYGRTSSSYNNLKLNLIFLLEDFNETVRNFFLVGQLFGIIKWLFSIS